MTSQFTEYIDGIPVHPVASLFPMIGDEELQALADDIKTNGQREKIMCAYLDEEMLDELVVIDGRNRFKACQIAGVEPEFTTNYLLGPDDIGPWIMSHNKHRRHMSKTQLATVAVGYMEWFAEDAKRRQIEGGRRGAEVTNSRSERVKEKFPEPAKVNPQASDEAGELMGVSGRTVRDATYVHNNDPEMFEKMRRNEITASAAAKRIRDSIKPKPQPTPAELAEKLVNQIAKHDEEVMELAWQILGEILGKKEEA